MKDQSSWDLAQHHSSKLMAKGFFFVLMFQLLLTAVAYFAIEYRGTLALISVFSIIPVLIYTGISTEKVLKEFQEKDVKEK